MGPKFCEKCKCLEPDGSCRSAKRCSRWTSWFTVEWQRIRKAAEKIKENRGGVPK